MTVVYEGGEILESNVCYRTNSRVGNLPVLLTLCLPANVEREITDVAGHPKWGGIRLQPEQVHNNLTVLEIYPNKEQPIQLLDLTCVIISIA